MDRKELTRAFNSNAQQIGVVIGDNNFDQSAIQHFSGQIQNNLVPMVVENDGKGERAYDLFSRLMKDNIITLTGPVHDGISSIIVAQLLFLEATKPDKELNFYINSPGGSVSAGMAMYDTMEFINNDVRTIGHGMNASMGSFLLTGGTCGKRVVLPNTRIMVHQPLGGSQGQETDMGIAADEIIKTRLRLEVEYAIKAGLSLEEVRKIAERDTYLNPHEAKELGLIDDIYYNRAMVTGKKPEDLTGEDLQRYKIRQALNERELNTSTEIKGGARRDIIREVIAARKARDGKMPEIRL